MTETLIGTIGAALLGWIGASFAWAFSINSRVSVVENAQQQAKEAEAERFQVLCDWLERIESQVRGGSRR